MSHTDHHHDHHGTHSHNHADQRRHSSASPRPPFDVWRDSLVATLAITLLGNVSIILFLWIDLNDSILKIMVGFAAGGLLGDVFLHLLPHASASSSPNSGLWVLAGIFSFFAIEKLVRLYGPPALPAKKTTARKKAPVPPPSVFSIKPAAFLNLVADTAHNFVDGMALSAAFQTSQTAGFAMTTAVVLHEIPHELGDFALLVSQGFSRRGAFLAQFGSAVGALAGCLFGLVVSSDEPVAVLNFTAGGFLYVALCDILPDLMQEASSARQTALEMAAAGLGVVLMVLIAHVE